LVLMGLPKSIKVINSAIAPKKLRKKAKIAGLEKSNASFMKGILEPHIMESNNSPPTATNLVFCITPKSF